MKGAYIDQYKETFGVQPICDVLAETDGPLPSLRQDLRERIEHHLFGHVADPWALFDAVRAAREIDVPMRLIHDADDDLVPFAQAHAPRAELVLTRGLGHRKVLGEPAVIDSALVFIAPAARRTTL
ncbi:hypothetical protein AB0F42_11520 [Streptomyces buecherae]|uniref:hypothetical protein n=1 Tax=Streptomyces buecherae TaxID=2763006 RepID=UPI0033D9251C